MLTEGLKVFQSWCLYVGGKDQDLGDSELGAGLLVCWLGPNKSGYGAVWSWGWCLPASGWGWGSGDSRADSCSSVDEARSLANTSPLAGRARSWSLWLQDPGIPGLLLD